MAAAPQSPALLTPRERVDVLAVAPLPYRVDGQGRFQFGAGVYSAALLRGLAGLGHRVRALAVSPRPTGRERPEPLGPGVEVDWFAIEYRHARTPPPPAYLRRQRARFEAALERAIAERRPDLVLLGTESQAWHAAEPCRDRELATLLVAHGTPTATLPAGMYRPRATAALIAHLQQVDQIVTVGHHLEEVLRSFGVARVKTIPTGVDTAMFRPRRKSQALLAALDIEPDRFVVGFFSHLRPGKRISDLIESAEVVLRSEPKTVYLIAGVGPSQDEALALVAEKGLGRSFRFLGELDHTAVPAHMALCDVVVLTSEREGCGLVCLEAQASGRPVIYSDIAAGHELVDHGETGLLFKVGDVGDLAAKTIELARDPALRRTLARKSREASLCRTTQVWIRAWSDAIVATATAARRRAATR